VKPRNTSSAKDRRGEACEAALNERFGSGLPEPVKNEILTARLKQIYLLPDESLIINTVKTKFKGNSI
jgi:hypothetical protein